MMIEKALSRGVHYLGVFMIFLIILGFFCMCVCVMFRHMDLTLRKKNVQYKFQASNGWVLLYTMS